MRRSGCFDDGRRREVSTIGRPRDELDGQVLDELQAALKKLLPFGIVAGVVGLFPLIIYGLSLPSEDFFRVVGVGAMAAAAALMAAAFFGFLFGIPRSLQAETSRDSEQGLRSGYRVNTNLEQISDWLTKILVGVGLTQIPKIGDAAGRLTASLAADIGAGPGQAVVIGGILVYFLASGFLGGYFLTRTVLTRAFTLSDAEMLSLEARMDRVEKVSKDAQDTSEQVARDVQALALVERLLNVTQEADGSQEPLPTDDQLRDAIRGSNPDVLRLVFSRARETRRTTWRSDKARMARTIPIFRALVELDSMERFHRPRGQLGYALKDQEVPQWRDAETQLDSAIRIRDRAQETGFKLYDFNRALCRIMRHRTSASGDGGNGPLLQQIISDLRSAAQEPGVLKRIRGDDRIRGWLESNEVAIDELVPGPTPPSRSG